MAVNVFGWNDWEFNSRGELYHTRFPGLVFTSKQLLGLHWQFQIDRDERANMRVRIIELEKLIGLSSTVTDQHYTLPRTASNVVIFPRYRRQRPTG